MAGHEFKFWMVWSPSGRPPSFKHRTAELATAEAERLAREHHTMTFYVLEAVERVRIVPAVVERVSLEGAEPEPPLDMIPF